MPLCPSDAPVGFTCGRGCRRQGTMPALTQPLPWPACARLNNCFCQIESGVRMNGQFVSGCLQDLLPVYHHVFASAALAVLCEHTEWSTDALAVRPSSSCWGQDGNSRRQPQLRIIQPALPRSRLDRSLWLTTTCSVRPGPLLPSPAVHWQAGTVRPDHRGCSIPCSCSCQA